MGGMLHGVNAARQIQAASGEVVHKAARKRIPDGLRLEALFRQVQIEDTQHLVGEELLFAGTRRPGW